MPYRSKVFVSFDGDSDIHYYRLMCAWKQNDNTSFDFQDAHDINTARDSSTEATIKRRLAERLQNSKMFVLLIGERTRYQYKFVRWEIEQALRLNLPIVCVNLNGVRRMDNLRCPPLLQDKLALHVSYNARIIQRALEGWSENYFSQQQKGSTGPFYHKDNVYASLGL
jgi:Thoeris protein ThsB, TIR-like domain